MTYFASQEVVFSAAHALEGHTGGCEHTHGHNYRVRATVRCEKLDKLGMAVDFKSLKRAMAAVVDPLDHAMLNDSPPFDRVNPTAENIARWIFERLEQSLAGGEMELHLVEVYETDTARAAFGRGMVL